MKREPRPGATAIVYLWTVLLLVVAALVTACSQRIVMQPGRDAVYSVNTQTVPAYTQGNTSQESSIHSSSVGPSSVGTSPPVYSRMGLALP